MIKQGRIVMISYIIGAAAGGLLGYFVFYKVIGCSYGSCAVTASPYNSILIGVALGVFIAAALTPTAEQYRKISPQEAKARMDRGKNVIIVDVRTEAEYNTGHIPGAILIPNESIGQKRPEQLPDLGAEILVYCRSGNRSAQAVKKLVKMGYTNVYDFGGINEWPYEIVN